MVSSRVDIESFMTTEKSRQTDCEHFYITISLIHSFSSDISTKEEKEKKKKDDTNKGKPIGGQLQLA
ncbi:unnamed protein product [Brugia pahangi]|uniref:Uncharacterized protein n=1 Tax=Brugia pahangi TaxID=6280 RepID=A0A0N4T1Q7_BRUPA|nr:unnamed protein product [Brugia pahangi]